METDTFEHRVMLNPDDHGTITWVAAAGEYTVNVEFVTQGRTDVAKQNLVRSAPIRTSTTFLIP